MNWQDYISITAGVRSGKPCVKGTRITVADVLKYLAGGMDEQGYRPIFRSCVMSTSEPCLVLPRNVNGT
jgi:uncharacterized protein (DUF433 family)